MSSEQEESVQKTIRRRKEKREIKVIKFPKEEKIDLAWDGSCLGDVSHVELRIVDKTTKVTYGSFNGVPVAMSSYSDVACVIDELKPVFGLPKVGIHSLVHCGKKYIIRRVDTTENGDIIAIQDMNLIYVDDEKCMSDIRRSYLFRYIVGLDLELSSLMVFNDGKDIRIVSMNGENTIPDEPSASAVVYRSVFDNKSLGNFMPLLVKKEEIQELLNEIENCIRRINPIYLCLMNNIRQRLFDIYS
jgi:hypothetical protein